MKATSGKIINYGDRWSASALWTKSILLLPAWAFLLLPLIGWMTSKLGSMAFQTGYLVMVMIGLAYFAEDVLRRKIRIDDNMIYFGYHNYRLADLASVGVVYSANRIVPTALLLYFGSGKKLELNLGRLTFKEFEKLLNLIENRVPHCAIDPVITTICKSKMLARKAALDESDRTEIVYHSRRSLKDMATTFITTAESWSRLGPSLMLLIAAPVWLSAIKGVYSAPMGNYSKESAIALYDKTIEALTSIDGAIGKGIADSSTAVWNVVSHPVTAIVLTLALIPIFYKLIELIAKPNRLIIDANGAQLEMKLGSIAIPMASANWSQIDRAYLSKPSQSAGPEQWSICLGQGGNKTVSLDLAAITPEDRTRFSRALERWAPHCALESDLAETLLPRQASSYTELWLQSLAAPPERASLEPLSAGRVLQEGVYEVLRRIGIGGQGAAYLCKQRVDVQLTASRQVVLKETIIPVFVEADIRKQALERFEQEARILGSLDSDHIVKLLDYFVEDHRGYLVLEWVDGKSLRQIIEDRGPMTEEQVVELCSQMCAMLEYLHGKSIIHRDFTPDNLILQKDGKLKLIDFNVAQTEEEGSSGVVVGKQAYMPAEQFRGKSTNQSDIYAMGATMFFLLTGADPEPITQSRVKEVKPNVSDRLDQVIQNCTALDCGKRFKSVSEITEGLSQASIKLSSADSDSIEIKEEEVMKVDA